MIKGSVQLLGPVLVEWETAVPPRFRSQRTMALLGYLAVEQRPVARETLAAFLWPDETLTTGKTNLRRELHNLNNILPGCWQTDRQVVTFLPAVGMQVDIYELLWLETSEQWSTAADLVRDEFLKGVFLEDNLEFESWLLGERERWRQRSERILRRAVEESVSAGDDTEALRHANRLLRLLPWHEEMHRQVMTLLAQRGQRSAALQQYEKCKEILRQELGVGVAAKTQALYERIRDTATFTLHNIPAPTTPLIGREEELALLNGWLADPDIRLITITSLGGIGKTRLALGLAHDYLDGPAHPFTDGIYLISLAALENPSHIVSTLAAVLKFPFQSRDKRSSREQLLDYFRQKKMLLILDNFEHLLPGTEIVTAILASAPDIQILVTSRERLNLHGEQVLPLEGLAYDEKTIIDSRSQSAAAQLFLTAAKRVQPAFMANDGDSSQLDRICRLVEGMPLALELAATWVDTLSLAAIAGEIEQGLGFLETHIRDLPKRHRSMEAVFDTAWQRLSPQEQAVFARLSVFRGGFTLDAAKTVTGATAKVLSRLVNRSLLGYVPQKDRYDIHELLRQYTADCLAPVESEQARTCHLTYFADLVERLQPRIQTPEQRAGMESLDMESGNLEAALDWALKQPSGKQDGLRLAASLEHYWYDRGYIREGIDWLTHLLAMPDPGINPLIKAEALRASGMLGFNYTGLVTKATALCKESLALQKLIGDKVGQVRTLCCFGYLEMHTKNYESSAAYYQKALNLAQSLNDLWSMCYSLGGLGRMALMRNEIKTARTYFERKLSLAKQFGAPSTIAETLQEFGLVAVEEKAWLEAQNLLQESLTIYREINDKTGVSKALRGLGDLAICQGQYQDAGVYYHESLIIQQESAALPMEIVNLWGRLGQTYLMQNQINRAMAYLQKFLFIRMQKAANHEEICAELDYFGNAACALQEPRRAARFWGAAEKAKETVDINPTPAFRHVLDHFVKLARNQIDEPTFQSAWSEGRAMSLEQAVVYALEYVDKP